MIFKKFPANIRLSECNHNSTFSTQHSKLNNAFQIFGQLFLAASTYKD